MAIRIRVIDGRTVALCAVETEAKLDDLYLNDSVDHALRVKFVRDYKSEGIDLNDINYPEDDAIAESQKIRDALTELDKWFDRVKTQSMTRMQEVREEVYFHGEDIRRIIDTFIVDTPTRAELKSDLAGLLEKLDLELPV